MRVARLTWWGLAPLFVFRSFGRSECRRGKQCGSLALILGALGSGRSRRGTTIHMCRRGNSNTAAEIHIRRGLPRRRRAEALQPPHSVAAMQLRPTASHRHRCRVSPRYSFAQCRRDAASPDSVALPATYSAAAMRLRPTASPHQRRTDHVRCRRDAVSPDSFASRASHSVAAMQLRPAASPHQRRSGNVVAKSATARRRAILKSRKFL